ncbi:MAG: TonB-dependent receptor [Chromatiales bacterium]|nr:TonB-dependent receptor [Chromatiales bacterium]
MSTKPDKSSFPIAVAVVLSACFAPVIMAADEMAFGDEDYLAELPFVLTVSRLPQKAQDLPASVTVIDRQMIEASGAKEIPEVLRLVAGFQVGHGNMIGPRTTVTYHGMSDHFARRMQILIDGRSIYTPATGGVDWYGLPIVLEDIERIEVTRGPNGVAYGANAFLGVINIITSHPNDLQGTLVKSTAGDNGYRNHLLRHAGKEGALDYRLSLNYQSDEGNENYKDNQLDAIRNDYRIQSASLRTDYRYGINDYLTMQLGASNGEMGDGVIGDITQPLHENEARQYFAQLKWKRIMSTDNDIEVQFYHNRNVTDADYFVPNLSTIFGITPAEVQLFFAHNDDPVYIPHSHTMRRSNIELVNRMKPYESLRLVWGAEARLDEVESPGLIGANSPVENRLYRLFANGEWTPVEDWVINMGVMAEKNDITDTRYSPRIAVNYDLSSSHTLRAAYSVNYRTPAIVEEYADYGARFFTDDWMIDQIWASQGDLDPEKSMSYEIALVGSLDNRKLQYDIRFFRDELTDLIATPWNWNSVENYSALCVFNTSFCRATAMRNGGEATISGYEIQTRYQVADKSLIATGYSNAYASGELLETINPDSYLSPQDSVPLSTFSVLAATEFGQRWQMSAAHYYVSDSMFIGGDMTGGIRTTDLRLAKGFNMSGVKGKLSIVMQDINGTYYDFMDSIERVRTTYLTAEFQF